MIFTLEKGLQTLTFKFDFWGFTAPLKPCETMQISMNSG